MRTLACLLLSACLAAQGPPAPGGFDLELHQILGSKSFPLPGLVWPGCWDSLLLRPAAHPAPPEARRGEATVEVWGLAFHESRRQEGFSSFLKDLRPRLLRALALPPPTHGQIELGEFMLSDPSNPQLLDLTKVQSLQNRYNHLPPNGSPVRQ